MNNLNMNNLLGLANSNFGQGLINQLINPGSTSIRNGLNQQQDDSPHVSMSGENFWDEGQQGNSFQPTSIFATIKSTVVEVAKIAFKINPVYDIFTRGLEKDQTAKIKRTATALVVSIAATLIISAVASFMFSCIAAAAIFGITVPFIPVLIIVAVAVISFAGQSLLAHAKNQYNKKLDQLDAELPLIEKTEKFCSLIHTYTELTDTASKLKNLAKCAKLANTIVVMPPQDRQRWELRANLLNHRLNELEERLSFGSTIVLQFLPSWKKAIENIEQFHTTYGSR